jgi:hypothetical protein
MLYFKFEVNRCNSCHVFARVHLASYTQDKIFDQAYLCIRSTDICGTMTKI